MGNNSIQYTYTSSGQKLSQQLLVDAGESVRRDYAGPFVYVNDTLAWINTPHGRIINRGFETDVSRSAFVMSGRMVEEYGVTEHPAFSEAISEV